MPSYPTTQAIQIPKLSKYPSFPDSRAILINSKIIYKSSSLTIRQSAMDGAIVGGISTAVWGGKSFTLILLQLMIVMVVYGASQTQRRWSLNSSSLLFIQGMFALGACIAIWPIMYVQLNFKYSSRNTIYVFFFSLKVLSGKT
jgi:hypothetical protein